MASVDNVGKTGRGRKKLPPEKKKEPVFAMLMEEEINWLERQAEKGVADTRNQVLALLVKKAMAREKMKLFKKGVIE